jgi:hypothetical protein
LHFSVVRSTGLCPRPSCNSWEESPSPCTCCTPCRCSGWATTSTALKQGPLLALPHCCYSSRFPLGLQRCCTLLSSGQRIAGAGVGEGLRNRSTTDLIWFPRLPRQSRLLMVQHRAQYPNYLDQLALSTRHRANILVTAGRLVPKPVRLARWLSTGSLVIPRTALASAPASQRAAP